MWPLRVLVIVGSSKVDKTIDAEFEVQSITGSLREISRTIELDIMRRPKKNEILDQYASLQPQP
jgi:hypothetical protein